jgi:hypothetical protein
LAAVRRLLGQLGYAPATSLHTRNTRIDRDRVRVFYERIGYRLKATPHLRGRP